MLQLWTKSNQKETVALELFYGVFVFDEQMKVKRNLPKRCVCFQTGFVSELFDEQRSSDDGKAGAQPHHSSS
jgi:hypothetical protein